MKITGLDLSLRKTGVAHAHLERKPWATTCRIQTPDKMPTYDRLNLILREVGNHTRLADLVLMENLAFGQSTNKAGELAGLHWLVRLGLYRRGIPHVVVTTQQLKIYATGKGTKVDKDDVLAAMIKRYPDVEIAGNDGADALALAALGAHYFGCRLRPVPQTHERALAMVAWPLWVQEMKEARDGASDHPSA